DPQGKAVNGIITDRDDGLSGLGEISVVDRGSNFGSAFTLIKAAADGTPEWVGKMVAEGGVITKDAAVTVGEEPAPLVQPKAPKAAKTVTVELPKNMSVSIKPTDLAKLSNFKRGLEAQRERMTGPEAVRPLAEALKTASPEVQAAKAAKVAGEPDPLAEYQALS